MTTSRLLLTIAAIAIGVTAALPKDIATQAKDDAFIFSSNSVVSALDHRQSLRLGERLTFAQLKRRLHSYRIERSHECEGSCIHVIGNNGVYLELADVPGERISGIIGFLGSRDRLGHVIGMSLIKAIGSHEASCDYGYLMSCASKLIKNLSYSVDDGACPDEDKVGTRSSPNSAFPYRVPECWNVGAMTIAR
jgi:hypothetical protein